jgi:hypothetical protein
MDTLVQWPLRNGDVGITIRKGWRNLSISFGRGSQQIKVFETGMNTDKIRNEIKIE